MIRELAENPNVHQALSAGRELVSDPTGRFAIYLSTGTGPHSATVQQADEDFATEGSTGSTFLAFVEGRPVAAGYASYTPLGLLLFGGATLPAARGRGAYRALVAARAREAAARGTPVLVTHAGQMSRPILERLGFTSVARIDRLLDVFPT